MLHRKVVWWTSLFSFPIPSVNFGTCLGVYTADEEIKTSWLMEDTSCPNKLHPEIYLRSLVFFYLESKSRVPEIIC